MRKLYLIAYDICEPGPVEPRTINFGFTVITTVLKAYSTGGQKSVFEC